MQKGINSDSQIHISIQLLVKAGILICIVVGSWYQAQMRFANIEIRMNDMHEEIVVLTSKVSDIERENIEELELEVQEQRSLLQKMGLKK
tara:strand:- start:396 stop:665 length:270 start_codon:yes stop_codon:yes gene_type:complete